MKYCLCIDDFTQWRERCRQLLALDAHPSEVNLVAKSSQAMLFETPLPDGATSSQRFHVPPNFIELAETASFHSDPARWNQLYATLWRLTHGEEKLLEITTDEMVCYLRLLEKQVRRDCHKTKAFVRFQKRVFENEEHYIAWHKPDHRILRRVAPFFARRFHGMQWSIFTPQESAFWNGEELRYGPGAARSEIASVDELESLWKTYYAATFNPARIKTAMMKREMPIRFWPTLPEATLIDELLEEAPKRVAEMVARTEGSRRSAADYLSEKINSIQELSAEAEHCKGCELCIHATQTVFGSGPQTAQLMLIGEQPGDEEDLAGKPFVSPSGRLLQAIFDELQIDRESMYFTNAVKHFSFEMQGKVRLHQKPTARQVEACKPWLLEEIRLVKPKVILMLGTTALHALLGRAVRLSSIRGQELRVEGQRYIASWHPAAILRATPEIASRRRSELQHDLAYAYSLCQRQPCTDA